MFTASLHQASCWNIKIGVRYQLFLILEKIVRLETAEQDQGVLDESRRDSGVRPETAKQDQEVLNGPR